MQTHSKQYRPYFVFKNNTADNVNMFTGEQLGIKLQCMSYSPFQRALSFMSKNI